MYNSILLKLLYWYIERSARETVFRLGYFHSLISYLERIPGGIPRRESSRLMKEHIISKLDHCFENLKSLHKGVECISCEGNEDKFIFKNTIKFLLDHNFRIIKTLADLRRIHRFLDRRVDSLALFPLIPRRFTRMSTVKAASLWSEFLESICLIIILGSDMESKNEDKSCEDILVTWHHIPSVRGDPVIEILSSINGEYKKLDVLSEITLPTWNILWYEQSMSLYHEIAETLLIRSYPNMDRVFGRNWAEYYKFIESIVRIHLAYIGGYSTDFVLSITNEIFSDTIGLVYGGVYYYVFLLLSLLTNAKISSGLAGKDFYHLGSDTSAPSRLYQKELDLMRFKEILRIRIVNDIFSSLELNKYSDKLRGLIKNIITDGNLVYVTLKESYFDPELFSPYVYQAIESTGKLLTGRFLEIMDDNPIGVESVDLENLVMILENTNWFKSQFKEDLQTLLGFSKTGKINPFGPFILSKHMIDVIKKDVIKKSIGNNKLKIFKALFPQIAFGMFFHRVYHSEISQKGLSIGVSRTINSLNELIDFLSCRIEGNENPNFIRTGEVVDIVTIDVQHMLSKFDPVSFEDLFKIENLTDSHESHSDERHLSIFWGLGHYSIYLIGKSWDIYDYIIKAYNKLGKKESEDNISLYSNDIISNNYWTIHPEAVLKINDDSGDKRCGELKQFFDLSVFTFLEQSGNDDVVLWIRIRHDSHFSSVYGQKILCEIVNNVLNQFGTNSGIRVLLLRSTSWPTISMLVKLSWEQLQDFFNENTMRAFNYISRSDTYILFPIGRIKLS